MYQFIHSLQVLTKSVQESGEGLCFKYGFEFPRRQQVCLCTSVRAVKKLLIGGEYTHTLTMLELLEEIDPLQGHRQILGHRL